MFLTPTYIGALLAGAAFWCLFWVTLRKLGEIPLVRHWLKTSRCLEWIRSHQSLALVITEATNLLLHGTTDPADPAGILRTLGGTAVNVGFVFGYLPSRDVLSLISARIRRSA